MVHAHRVSIAKGTGRLPSWSNVIWRRPLHLCSVWPLFVISNFGLDDHDAVLCVRRSLQFCPRALCQHLLAEDLAVVFIPLAMFDE